MVHSKLRSSTSFNGQVGKGVVDLPLETISDILTRLPIESILICRVVCKSWYDLTRDPDFVRLQLSRSNYQRTRFIIQPTIQGFANDFRLLLLDAEEHNIKQIPIEREVLKGAEIMCSCNGLLFIIPYFKLNPMVIYNPMTRQRLILPSLDCEVNVRPGEVRPTGFGFDLSTGRYKVVREYLKGGIGSNRFWILSVGESSWRKLSPPPLCLIHWTWYGSESVFWKGVLYWKMVKLNFQGYDEVGILAFDLSEEKFQIISFPQSYTNETSLDLLDLDGRLTLVAHEPDAIMKLWRLAGKKIGDFSFCLEQTYDTYVRWNKNLFCQVISRVNHNGYLLFVVLKKDGSIMTHVTKFFPQMAQYMHLDLPLIADCFGIHGFRPSLECPVSASHLS
ncbi:F-box/LRR-repeat protein At2g43260-like [Cornus florida]|uniref:F-box/LRR-repeat protein At2g43260-like n=1 Tax=Cornus florida TaxID=4283 RepID=UPI0028A08330|nr:F-box/LRR-repeat protein At2g43260-like [Cornus florida]XP_059640191.1 F-box/LRR-repeat protein At2g43260-like [Cornus florida]XP_059640192.1 F-box/LRR-repeat protein At2g43260-like [Cornus florida]XP_059640193.1 F-box/LRR-repeat protein At2g43260-like [Cornus florida]XP_059640194.1 F-box/LRR-repeat protein At2g43260-like [Cornus florida]XP_059640195.1 F-box/LRR-repeat protein At2g43260-like [Cornus florida]XP_059640196.1 F-box/LRR-repeat protein At2g43260-like [Cornus florida]XP_05964019